MVQLYVVRIMTSYLIGLIGITCNNDVIFNIIMYVVRIITSYLISIIGITCNNDVILIFFVTKLIYDVIWTFSIPTIFNNDIIYNI